MGYKIDTYRQDPIYVVAFDQNMIMEEDGPAAMAELRAILDNLMEPVSIVYDLRYLSIPLREIMDMLRYTTNDDLDLTKHPMLIAQMLLTDDDIKRNLGNLLKSFQQGGESIAMASSMETAVNQLRTTHAWFSQRLIEQQRRAEAAAAKRAHLRPAEG